MPWDDWRGVPWWQRDIGHCEETVPQYCDYWLVLTEELPLPTVTCPLIGRFAYRSVLDSFISICSFLYIFMHIHKVLWLSLPSPLSFCPSLPVNPFFFPISFSPLNFMSWFSFAPYSIELVLLTWAWVGSIHWNTGNLPGLTPLENMNPHPPR